MSDLIEFDDRIELTEEEQQQGFALRNAVQVLPDQSQVPVLMLYQATQDLHGKNTNAGYYHCHLPGDTESLFGLVLVILKHVQAQGIMTVQR